MRDECAARLDAGDVATAEEDQRHRVGAVVQLGLERGYAADRPQRHGPDLPGHADRLAVRTAGDGRAAELVNDVVAQLFRVKLCFGCGDLAQRATEHPALVAVVPHDFRVRRDDKDDRMNARAVIAHGAGSSADFVGRAFGEPLAAAGFDVVSWDRRTPVASADLELAQLVARTGATVVGGVSVGALLATRFALSPGGAGLAGLLVALPPPPPRQERPDDNAGAPEIDELIELACRTAVPWVAAEIRAAWPTYESNELLHELRTASVATTPTAAELANCRVPTGVVALAGDPVHPVEVAAMWANAIPRAALETVPLVGPATSVSVIGAAAVRAWQRACVLSGSQ